MCFQHLSAARVLLGRCCCFSSHGLDDKKKVKHPQEKRQQQQQGQEEENQEEGKEEEDIFKEEIEKKMALGPTRFQSWGGRGGAQPSTSRLPSTRLAPGRPVSLAPPSVIASLAVEEKALRSERRSLAFRAGAKVIPHPAKVEKGGEDAYFISDYNHGVLGVADGVSGWAAENVDPALFSKELMAHAEAAVRTDEVKNDPRLLLAKAHSATVSIGAATAIVAILDKDGVLHVANVGDCGLRIVRDGRVVHATAPQQHYFDCPYQLSSEEAQTAADAAIYELGVLEGDTIVMGSDGLFDNVYDYDIEEVVKLFNGTDEDPAACMAVALASLACKHAQDRKYDSPYAQEAILQGHDLPWWRKVLARQKIGGKIDDITVVVGRVVSAPISTAETGAASEGLAPGAEEKSADVSEVSAAAASKERLASEGVAISAEEKSTDVTDSSPSSSEGKSSDGSE